MALTTRYLNLTLEHPFVLASAPPTANGDMIRRAFEAGWAGAAIKTMIRAPVKNLRNRFAVTRHGGAITGFENLELLSEVPPDDWFRTIAGLKRDFPGKAVIGSIMGDARAPDDWLLLARGCQDAGADMLELNFSCPHGCPEQGRGSAIGQSAEYSAAITRWLTAAPDIHLPIIPKLTAAVADIQHIGRAVAASGAHGLCAINTMPALFGFDLKTLRPKPDVDGRTAFGGYSGVGIKPIALRAVAMLCQAPALPVMASGGIASGFDAAEFMLLGAPVVQVCTAVMLRGFDVVRRMQAQLLEFMSWHGFSQTADFVGRCRELIAPFSGLVNPPLRIARWDGARCTRCGACHVACRDGAYQAIARDGDKLRVDDTRCVGCSLCTHVCPAGAISLQAVE